MNTCLDSNISACVGAPALQETCQCASCANVKTSTHRIDFLVSIFVDIDVDGFIMEVSNEENLIH